MEHLGLKIQNYIEEIEKYTNELRQELAEERKEIENSEQKVEHLLNSFYYKESNVSSEDSEPMKISVPYKSVLDSIFKEEEEEDTGNGFLFSEEREEKRRKLAEERRAEYNAYLARKDQELSSKKKILKESNKVIAPKSLLESVDYETILAKRKEEELKFRELNHGGTSFKEDFTNNRKSSSEARTSRDPTDVQQEQIKRVNVYSNDTPVNSVELLPYRQLNNREPSLKQDLANNRIPLPKTVPETSNYRYLTDWQQNQNKNVNEYSNDTPVKSELLPYSARYNPPTTKQEIYSHRRTGGGGEPVKDFHGNLITHRGYREVPPILQLPSFLKEDNTFNKIKSYREQLAEQIEERKQRAAIEKQRAQLLDEQEEAKIKEMPKIQIKSDYEIDPKEKIRMKEQKLQEHLRRLKEFEDKDKDEREKLRKEKMDALKKVTVNREINTPRERSVSPPVPAVRSKELFEKMAPIQKIPKVDVKPETVFTTLAEIRRKIMQDQQNLNQERSYEVMNRRTVPDVQADDDENYVMQGITERVEELTT